MPYWGILNSDLLNRSTELASTGTFFIITATGVRMTDSTITELVRRIAIALVDKTDRVEINEICGNMTNVIELKVAKEDIGKVIGRQGRTADAIRTIVNCAAAKYSKRYILEILDQ